MPTCELHQIYYDKKKESIVIGYVCEPHTPLPPQALQHSLDIFLQLNELEITYINIIPFYLFNLSLNQQQAIITFLNTKKEHTRVQTLIHIYNNNASDINALTRNELDQKFNHDAQETIEELLVDVMLEQVR